MPNLPDTQVLQSETCGNVKQSLFELHDLIHLS